MHRESMLKNPLLVKNTSFVAIWIGNVISELGGALGTFCLSILVYQETGSPLALGSMWLLYFLPSLLLQLGIGPFIDKWSRKWLMIFSQCSRGFIFCLPVLALSFQSLEVWHLYIVQIIVGLITPIYTPANHAILPTLLHGELLLKANAMIDGTVRLMTFLAPIAAGILLEYIGETLMLLIVVSLYVFSGGLLLFVKEKKEDVLVRRTWLSQFKLGISTFYKQKNLLWLGIFLAFVQFGVGATMVLNLPFITGDLGASIKEYGYFVASFPLGYVIGSLIVGFITYKSKRILLLSALAVGGLTYVSLSITTSLTVAIFTEIIAGVALAVFGAHNIAIFQKVVPNQMLGSIMSVRMLIVRGVMPLGILFASTLSEIVEIRPLFFLIGFIIFSSAMIGLVLPYFSFLDGEDVEEKVA
ncbi:MFS transporter [Metabacillus sp. HB246100]